MSNVTIKKRGNFYQYKFEIAKTGNSFSATDMSYSDFLDYWLENYCYINLKYHTIEGYSNIIKNYIKPNIGYFRLSQITRATLQEFINKIILINHLVRIF